MPNTSNADFIIDVLISTGGADQILKDMRTKIKAVAQSASLVSKNAATNAKQQLSVERERLKNIGLVEKQQLDLQVKQEQLLQKKKKTAKDAHTAVASAEKQSIQSQREQLRNIQLADKHQLDMQVKQEQLLQSRARTAKQSQTAILTAKKQGIQAEREQLRNIQLTDKHQLDMQVKQERLSAAKRKRVKTEAADEARASNARATKMSRENSIRNAMASMDRRVGGISRSPFGQSVEGQKEIQKFKDQIRDAKGRLAVLSKQNNATREDFQRLRNSIDNSTRNLRDLNVKAAEYNKSAKTMSFVSRSVTNSMMNMARSFLSVYAAVESVRGLFTLSANMESLDVQMQQTFGSAEAGGKQMEYIKQVSMELGTSLQVNAQGYAQISSAAQLAGLNMQQSRTIFMGVSEAAVAFGLTVENQQGVMKAFTQMLGKQQVMA